MVVLAGACAVLTSGQTTLPNSLATLIPTGTATKSATSSVKVTSGSVTSPSPTGFSTITTTAASSGPTQSTTIVKEGALATTNNSGPSTGALIGGIALCRCTSVDCRYRGRSSRLYDPGITSHVRRIIHPCPKINREKTSGESRHRSMGQRTT